MILMIKHKEGKQEYEEIRTAYINNGKLVYYRKNHYSGEKHEIDIENIEYASVVAYGREIILIGQYIYKENCCG